MQVYIHKGDVPFSRDSVKGSEEVKEVQQHFQMFLSCRDPIIQNSSCILQLGINKGAPGLSDMIKGHNDALHRYGTMTPREVRKYLNE
ncbi:hypothetical protein, partial [Sphingobacterium sp. UBA5670]|uniref:hypothetical protein n=1 Tax=Sphingobacterium sp. UBA5670 TaxID=1947502 RepID=UPI0025D03125